MYKKPISVKSGHLHPEYAANLVASSEYYHCHWILLTVSQRETLYLPWWLYIYSGGQTVWNSMLNLTLKVKVSHLPKQQPWIFILT